MASTLELDPAGLARLFEQFGKFEAPPNHSPLYARLCLEIAEDPELLTLAARARSFPVPNVFLAAVHYLVLGGTDHPLARFYPTAGGAGGGDANPGPDLRDFCLAHRDEIGELIATRRTQTNEVRRCAVLLPALALASQRSGAPLALVEIGASAGLNLLFDRYAYDYGTAGRFGDPKSPLHLECAWRASAPPAIPTPLPAVFRRVGLELEPIDLADDDATRWLEAFVWPEHTRRLERLRGALEIARRDPPAVIAGDALDTLPTALGEIPSDATPVVLHSFTVGQFGVEARRRLASILREHGATRPLYRITLEGEVPGGALLRLLTYAGADRTNEMLATAHAHGDWIDWGGSP